MTVVDTPGFGDSDKEDSVLIDEMMGVLKNTIKSASVLFIVLDGNQVCVGQLIELAEGYGSIMEQS